MIRLTRYSDPDDFLYINTDKIAFMEEREYEGDKENKLTRVYLDHGDRRYDVKESPEEIIELIEEPNEARRLIDTLYAKVFRQKIKYPSQEQIVKSHNVTDVAEELWEEIAKHFNMGE